MITETLTYVDFGGTERTEDLQRLLPLWRHL